MDLMIRSRNSLLVLAVAVVCVAAAGCANQPAQPRATRQVPIDSSNVAEVQRAGYKIVNKDGQKLYCRTDPITGSRIQTRTQCLTEQELYDQMEQTKESMTSITTNNPGKPGH
jgi:hypothetical protein